MKKYLAESTLKKKYRELGLSKDIIKKLHFYLLAAVNLYGTLTQDEMWRVVKTVERRQRKEEMDSDLRFNLFEAIDEYLYSVNGSEAVEDVLSVLTTPMEPELTREQFDAFMTVASREQNMFLFNTEDEFYEDGKPEITYISDLKLLAGFESIEDMYDMVDTVDEESTEITLSYDGFFAVNEARQGKTLIVPSDLLCYICQTYYHMTDEDEDVMAFLLDRMKGLTPVQASTLVFRIYGIIRNPLVPLDQKVQKAVEAVEKYAYFRSEREVDEFTGLIFAFMNATRIMENKGQSPNELTLASGGVPRAVPYTGNNGPSSVLTAGKSVFEAQTLQALEETLKPGESKVVNAGGTVVKGKKIGPNEPCPCGSGKKYKKCCGRVVNND